VSCIKPTLSVVIIAKNEAHHLPRCLDSVRFADEIIVLDSGSEDASVAISKTYTPHVFETDWQGYGIQKQRALSYATGDWVLNLDADESVSPALETAILRVIATDKADAYRIPIQMVFYQKSLQYSGSPSRHIRLFKREGARYSDDIVHEKICLPSTARVQALTAPLIHHSFRDLSHALDKLNRYSSYSAKIRLQHKRQPHAVQVLLASTWMFVRCFLLQRGFLDGQAGLILACLQAQGTFYRGMKQIYTDQQLDALPIVKKDSIHE